MTFAELFHQSTAVLASPAVLSFVTGVAGGRIRTGLALPESVLRTASFFLLLVIGYKGGIALGGMEIGSAIWVASLTAIGLSLFMAMMTFIALRTILRLGLEDAGAMAAHYGSVSVVTFVTAAAYLDTRGVAYDGIMIALLALMESPGIILALALARRSGTSASQSFKSAVHIVKDSFMNPSILTLFTGIAIGLVVPASAAGLVQDSTSTPFYVVLSVFLLGMGLKAGARMRDFTSIGLPLIAFAVLIPLLGAALGILSGILLGWNTANVFLLGILCASASYIAAPAVVRTSLPGANPAYYVTTSLAVTFPFNILVGIPLYFVTARLLVDWLR